MNTFEEAARMAAEECFLSDWRYVGIIEPIIAKHHADLKATHEVLLEYCQCLEAKERKFFNPLVAIANEKRIKELRPLVKAAIEGREK